VDANVTGAPAPRFDRRFFEGVETFTAIGAGAIGGKASGLQRARELLDRRPDALRFPTLEISVPTLTVIATGVFDAFVERNGLRELAVTEPGDHHVARAFQRAPLPDEIAGDLWALVRRVHTPLAVRSSSLLEDAIDHPLAGVYGTKMTANDAFDPDLRFRRLVEAVKFVWASTFFRGARAAIRAAGRDPDEEKMAVIVQEVVGVRRRDRFYPHLSAVARSFNFYPVGEARPEDGVMDLALGLGKTIVDGGRTWTCSPAHPHAVPPFNSVDHMLDESQREFWAVRMGPPPVTDPTAEDEYLVRGDLADAERDGALTWLASTYDPERDRVVPGIGASGPRMVDFRLLVAEQRWPLNEAVQGLLELFGREVGAPVELELALTLPEDGEDRPARLGFLQVRPMALSSETITLDPHALTAPGVVVASTHVMGNGTVRGLRDVVFVRPETFEGRHTPAIAEEVRAINRTLADEGRPYVLVGFGRWGSADPWLGVPVAWPDIAGARVIVEAATPSLRADLSQGAHFFHNLLGFRVAYYSVPEDGDSRVDWTWLAGLRRAGEGGFVVHARTDAEMESVVDGRTGRGVVRPVTRDAG
jgi:hypothetical protein